MFDKIYFVTNAVTRGRVYFSKYLAQDVTKEGLTGRGEGNWGEKLKGRVCSLCLEG
jgi:hypothetical protein